MAFWMDVFTKRPLVARKRIVEDSGDINTEYLVFSQLSEEPRLPAGLRSQWWSKGWFLSGISHRRNTFIIEPVNNLENIKAIAYEHLLKSGLTHLVTPSSCWFPGFLSLRILQPNCRMFSSWPLTVPRGRRGDGQRRPSWTCLQTLMHVRSMRRALQGRPPLSSSKMPLGLVSTQGLKSFFRFVVYFQKAHWLSCGVKWLTPPVRVQSSNNNNNNNHILNVQVSAASLPVDSLTRFESAIWSCAADPTLYLTSTDLLLIAQLSFPPPPFHCVTVDTWHLQSVRSSPTHGRPDRLGLEGTGDQRAPVVKEFMKIPIFYSFLR